MDSLESLADSSGPKHHCDSSGWTSHDGSGRIAGIFGYDGRDLFIRAGKTLTAGLAGVFIGSLIQGLLLPTHWPIFLTYWLGAFCGFVVNFATQVKTKNIPVKAAE